MSSADEHAPRDASASAPTPPPRLAFAELALPGPVRRGIEDAGFIWCTPIQAETLPTAITGRDIAGQAQTGTGKTAAFLIACFTLLLERPRRHEGPGSCPRALVIAPTRELAMQIRDEAELLGRHTGLALHAVYGGVDYHKQLDRLAEGVDVLIGTPGRLIDYFKQKVFTLKDTEILIVDEADRMFDMGFIDDLRYLVKRMPAPEERTSFLYSATLSFRVLELAYEHMHDVHRVAIDEEQVTAERVDQLVYHVGIEEKLPVLLNLLAREQPPRALVFVNTRKGVHFVAERLERHGYAVGVLVGDVDQKKRIRMLRDFKEDRLRILVATDVASRGLHIEGVTHVFNYDLPQDPEDYVHRIGRTARAGASGKALSLACEHHVYSLEAIEEFIGMRVPHAFPEEDLTRMPKAPPRRPRPEAEAVEEREDGPRGDAARRGRGPGRSRDGDARSAGEPDGASSAGWTEASTEATPGEGDGAPRKKRRRSRSRRKGSATRGEVPAAEAGGASATGAAGPEHAGAAGPEHSEEIRVDFDEVVEADAGAGEAPRPKRRRRRRRRTGAGTAEATPAEPGE